jgi:PIN domain nuclease of toxin-antitoxin system
MRALLDTVVFLWAIEQYERLSPRARFILEDPASELFLSTASLWEILLKASQGKLLLGMSAEQQVAFLLLHVEGLQLRMLPITTAHVLGIADLLPIHKDPFDRLLVAQARAENLILISKDPEVSAYGGFVLW